MHTHEAEMERDEWNVLGVPVYELYNPGQRLLLEMLESFCWNDGGGRMNAEKNEGKYELHLVFASEADRDWMVQMIQEHLMVLDEKVE
jgi:hypothetical protein